MEQRMLDMCEDQRKLRTLYRQQRKASWNLRKKILFTQYRHVKFESMDVRMEKLRQKLKILLDEDDYVEIDGKIIMHNCYR
jgi:hypothetical protein